MADLQKAITEDYDQWNKRDYTTVDLLKNGNKYTIEEVDQLDAPILRGSGSGSLNDGGISLSFYNYGASGKITQIINEDGTQINWAGLPLEIIDAEGQSSYRQEGYVNIYGDGYKQSTSYKFKMVVEDAQGRKSTYRVEGINLDRTLVRLD